MTLLSTTTNGPDINGPDMNGSNGGPTAVEAHLYRSLRICPVGFAHEALGVQLWDKQQEVLNAVRDYRRVAVKAGNGLGKGFTAAVSVLWFLCTHHPAIVLTTAPTARQVRHVLWREIRRLHRGAHQPIGGHMLQTRYEAAEDRFALGLSTDEVDQFQGFHSPNMLIVVDEAEGVTEEIYEAIDAVMTAGSSKLLLIGNPTSITGTFRRAFHEDRRLYHNITISALDSPNVKEQHVVIPGLTTHEWVAERLAIWGQDSPMYHARVLGDFSDRAENSLISLDPHRRSHHPRRQPSAFQSPRHPRAGGDPRPGLYGKSRTISVERHTGFLQRPMGRRRVRRPFPLEVGTCGCPFPLARARLG